MIETKYNEIEDNNIKYIFKFITFIITIFFVIFIIYAFKLGIYEDKDILVNYIKKLGIGAPIIFIVLQIIQVVIPVIPGGITCLAGVLAFGPVLGFIYNYIALIIGSIIVYYISVKYGIEFINKFYADFLSEIKEKYNDLNGYYIANKEKDPLLAGLAYLDRGDTDKAAECFASPNVAGDNSLWSVTVYTDEQRRRAMENGKQITIYNQLYFTTKKLKNTV